MIPTLKLFRVARVAVAALGGVLAVTDARILHAQGLLPAVAVHGHGERIERV